MYRHFSVALMISSFLFLSGCAHQYLLTSQFVSSTQAEAPPEIISTPTYLAQINNIGTVAVRAPDTCSNSTLDTATGGAASQETSVKTWCGVEIAEIEKGLTRNGYRVISWKVLAQEMNAKNLSAIEIANSLGADAVFQINSLEKSRNTPGKDARWERKYFRTNDNGAMVSEQIFDDETRGFLKARYLENYEKRADFRRLSITLDANAVLVKTGEAFWFYRWRHTDPEGLNYTNRVFLQCKSNNRDCTPFTPRNAAQIKTTTRASGDSEAISITERPEDLDRATYSLLLSSVIANLVDSFSSERGRGN